MLPEPFDPVNIQLVRSHLSDDSSRVLFDGRLSYRTSKDPAVLGASIRSYFLSAPDQIRKDSADLFAHMEAAFSSPSSPAGQITNPVKVRFESGLQASPEPYTDIYNCFFDSGIFHPGDHEIFVDGGAEDLFTSYRFDRKCKGRYHAIYAFEPSRQNIIKCRQNAELFDDRLKLYQTALYSKRTALPFTESAENSFVQEEEASSDAFERVPADTLDHIFEKTDPTFLKLHLEGSEDAALFGAGRMIRRARPLIAVTIDHRVDDFQRIPFLLLDFYDKYSLFLRHYSAGPTETVLYAVP